MSHPPYSFGPSNDPGQQPPADPYQPSGYPPPYPDPAYGDPGYHDPGQQHGYPGHTGYQPTQPYPPQQYSGGYPGQQPGYPSQPYSPGPSYPQQPGYGAHPPYPGYPGYPPEPPKGNRTGVIVGVVAVLLVLVVGGGVAAAFAVSHDKKQPLAQTTGGPAASASSTAGGGTDDGALHSGDLRRYLVPMPSGAHKCADEEGTDESLSLEQASNLSSDHDSRKQQLEHYKFKGGAVRCWVTSDHTTVDVRLYQFGSTDNAKSFFDSDIDGTGSDYTADNTTDVTGVPDGKSFASPEKNDQGYVQVISIGRNGDVVLVIAIAQLPPLKVSVSDTLLQQEYQKL